MARSVKGNRHNNRRQYRKRIAKLGIQSGFQVDGSNTGINGVGLTSGELTAQAGGNTSGDGQIIEGIRFTSALDVVHNNVTIRQCQFGPFASGDGFGMLGLGLGKTGITLEDVTFINTTAVDGQGVINRATGVQATRLDMSGCPNSWRDVGIDTLLSYSYLHDPMPNDPGVSHRDMVELFENDGLHVYRCRIEMDPQETACVNIAPFGGGNAVDVTIEQCHIDGGNAHILLDNQGTGDITFTRIINNTMGGHTNPAGSEYAALINNDSRPIVDNETDLALTPTSILWSGNTWLNTQADTDDYDPLTPSREFELITV